MNAFIINWHRLSMSYAKASFTVLIFLFFAVAPVEAQLSITSTGTNFTQNFDGMGTAAAATVPGGFKAGASNNHSSNGTATSAASSAPASNATGACYNYGNTQNSADRCVGFLTSGSYTSPKHVTLQVTNNTGAAISGFTLNWNYEKYRSGSREFNWTFFHGAALAPTTAATAGDQNYPADAGNTTTYPGGIPSVAKTVTITGLNLANGASYYFTWTLTGVGGSSNGQGLGIDDFVINAAPASCSAPSTQASNITFSTTTSTSTSVNWTNGNGGGRVILINTTNSFTTPTNGSNPTANAVYAGSGEQVVFNGTGSGPVSISGLNPNSTYHFRVYEFCTPSRNYVATTGTNNPNSVTTLPLTSITTSTSIGSAPFTLANCAAVGSGTVGYTLAGTYNAGNVFTAQLSNASGSFSSPTDIGTLSSTSNGTINITIPAATESGTGYKIRVVSSNPVITGSESSAFTITQNGVCASLSTHYFRSKQTGFWNSTGTWESSPDQLTWINATKVPNDTSAGILIQSPHNVTVNAAASMDQATIENGAILTYAGGGLVIANGAGDDLTINGIYIHTGGTLPTGTGAVIINAGGVIRVDVNTASSSVTYAGSSSTRYFYKTGATFRWNNNGLFSTSGQTYFPNSGVNDIPTFLLTANITNAGGGSATIVNGVFEVGAGSSISWTGAGPKTFRNGIRIGSGASLAQNTSATFLITGATAEFDGPGILALPTGLTSTSAQLDNGSSITVNGTGNVTVNGGWIGHNNTISGTSEIIFGTGGNLSGKTTFTRFGVAGNASIASGIANGQTVTEYANLRSGTLTTNDNITFTSNSSGTAYINDFTIGYTGSISGNVHIQRYIPIGLNGFRQLGTPVQISNISALDGFTPSGTAGFIIPVPTCHPNYVAYNSPYGNWMQLVENATVQYACSQSLFEVITSGGMTNGRGYYMDVAGDSTLTFTGTPNTGIISFGLTHANTAVSNGWNMVSNPYPSPLQWELLNVPVGVDAIGKVWQTSGAYQGTWQDLDPSASGTQAVAIGQAFQVRVSIPNVSVPFLVDNTDRTTSPPTYLFAGGDPMTLNIDIQGGGFSDLCKIRFMDGATPQMDAMYDSPKMMGNANQPMVYSVWNGNNYSTNSFHAIDEALSIPLGVKLPGASQHTFMFSNLDQFPASAEIYLEDTQAGIMQNLRMIDSYTFMGNMGENTTRFILHFFPPVEKQTVDAVCAANGSVTVSEVNPASYAYSVTDTQNTIVAEGVLNENVTVNNLAPGIYSLHLTNQNNGYVSVENFTIGGSAAVEVTASASVSTISVGQDVQFAANSSTANAWQWSFGDGNTSNEQNPLHTFNVPGNFTIALTASNGNCSDVSQIDVHVSNNNASINNETLDGVEIWNVGHILTIRFEEAWSGKTSLSLYDMQGKKIFDKQFNGMQATMSIDCGVLTAGMYTVVLTGEHSTLSQKIVVSK